ncbi:MAG: winged helix-turn-helix domain-containing protein [Desulfobulbaceae bacterium]|nr:winged helix-turn-helix domain-containing protein [Desulfobulbaceae bacterium]
MTETSIKVGKALARTSIKAEKSTQKVKKMAEELLDTVTGKQAGKKNTATKTKKTATRSRALPLSPATGLSVEGHLGFLAGDLYQILETDGETAVNKLVGSLKKRSHSEAMIYAAIGWLAREGQVTFTPDGKNLMLR